MVIEINSLSFEEWEKQANVLKKNLGIKGELVNPFYYWQDKYSPAYAVLDMFRELQGKEIDYRLVTQEAI